MSAKLTGACPTGGSCSGSRARSPNWNYTRSAAGSPPACSTRLAGASWRCSCRPGWCATPQAWSLKTRTKKCRTGSRWCSTAFCSCARPGGSLVCCASTIWRCRATTATAKPTGRGVLDRLAVEQVVENLLSNALKFGAGEPVTLRLRSDGRSAQLEVQDRGVGRGYA